MSGNKEVFLERGWTLIMRDMGVHPENVLRRAQLPLDLLSRENARLSVDEYFRLWNGLEAEAADPALPIRLAEALSTEAFHPPIFAALCSPDMTVAAGRIAEYKRLVAPMTVQVEERSEGLFVGMRWNDPDVQVPTSLAVMELTFLTQIARIATREPIHPVRVESPHPMQPASAYEEYFGVAPRQGIAHGVTFSPADARRPFLTASESLWQTFEPELRRRLTQLEASASLAERVRAVLLESLPSGDASVLTVARRLGVSPRTLQRRLQAEGTSFKDVVRQTRERLARHYLNNTNLAYTEISFLIGFEEPSSFFRAFREWTGETPETTRLAYNT